MKTISWPSARIWGLLGSCLMLIACDGEFSYKRGATAQDLENTKRLCKTSGGVESAEACLKKNGWVVQQLDDLDLFAIPSVNPDNRGTPPSKPKTSTTQEASSAAQQPSATADRSTSAPAPAPAKIIHQDDEIFSIGSWWKIGGNDTSLKSDIKQCVDKLGVQHKPDIAAQQYTYAMVVCLHEKGWKALKNVK